MAVDNNPEEKLNRINRELRRIVKSLEGTTAAYRRFSRSQVPKNPPKDDTRRAV